MIGASPLSRPSSGLGAYLFLYAMCFFIMFVPFIVASLYYAYNDVSCSMITGDFWGFAKGINFDLRKWLQIDAYIALGFLIIFLILGGLAWCLNGRPCVYGFWEGLHVLFFVWRLVWLIVGAVLFWKDINPTGFCARPFANYMKAMLIIGFVWFFVQIFLAFGYPRAIPVPSHPLPIVSPNPMITQNSILPGAPYYNTGTIIY